MPSQHSGYKAVALLPGSNGVVRRVKARLSETQFRGKVEQPVATRRANEVCGIQGADWSGERAVGNPGKLFRTKLSDAARLQEIAELMADELAAKAYASCHPDSLDELVRCRVRAVSGYVRALDAILPAGLSVSLGITLALKTTIPL